MCGIIGYVGDKPAVEILKNALTRLEYRGYDSAGIATIDGGKIHLVIREEGRSTIRGHTTRRSRIKRPND